MNGIVKVEEINVTEKINKFHYNQINSGKVKFTSIIILTYNQLEYTKLCIQSIRKFTDTDKYEIIIVDNNSTDGTVEWLKSQKDLKIIYNRENKGFPAGCNQGIQIANGENILLLNNDVIVTPNWLNNLDRALWSDESIGAVGAVSNNCSYYQDINVSYENIDEMLEFADKYNKLDETYWSYRSKLIGFCMLIKKTVLEEVGLLDEIFTPGNFEDDDLSFRIICKGYKLLLCKDTFVHHFGSVSFKNLSNSYLEIINENINKFKVKWGFNPKYSNMIRFDLINQIEDNDRERKLNVLEIGCGTGATLLEIKNRYKNAKIYGIEICKASAKIASNICDIMVGNIENIDLPYEKDFFDYIILGDVLEHLNNPWDVLNDLKTYLKRDGYVIASIPNIMHISVMKDLAVGKFSYQEAGILDRTHLRFFTLSEIEKLFNNNSYDINNISFNTIPISRDHEEFINVMCSLYSEELRIQYMAYQYMIKAKKKIDYSRYNDEDMGKLKYALMRIDNELDVESSVEYILNFYNMQNEEIIDDLEYLLNCSIINKDKVLNKIGTACFNKGLYEFSISIFMLAMKINRDNIDALHNLIYLLKEIGEYEIAMSIFKRSSNSVKSDLEIVKMIESIEAKIYG